MPNSIATAVAPLPRHYDVPQPLTPFDPTGIKQLEGLYCLNDLHKMAGGKPKDTPSRFIILAKTQALIQAFERLAQIQNPKKGFDPHNPKKGSDLSPVIRVIHGGDMQGVYTCKPLMFAYTSWLNADFHALVYSVFDHVTSTPATGEITYTMRANMADKGIKDLKAHLSDCGSDLCVLGKQVMPALVREQKKLHNEQQPQLPFTGE